MLWALIFWVLLAVSNFIFFPPFSYQVLAQCLFHYLNISCIHILTTGMYIYSYGETMSTHYWLYGQGSCLWPKEHILPCLYVLSWGNPMTVTTPLQSCTLSVTTLFLCFSSFLPVCPSKVAGNGFIGPWGTKTLVPCNHKLHHASGLSVSLLKGCLAP